MWFWNRLLACVSSSVVEDLANRLEYVLEENRVLRSKVQRRLQFSDSERVSLASRAVRVGRKKLGDLSTVVSPETLLRWHRTLVARKHDYSHRRKPFRPGRPSTSTEIENYLIRLPRENRGWGYCKLQAGLKYLGHAVSPSTIKRILRKHDLPPAPERNRHTPWHEFIRTHADAIWACDFFTTEVWTRLGLSTYSVLFFIHFKTRRVVLGGIHRAPKSEWVKQIARSASMETYGFLTHAGCRYLIHDRDPMFTSSGFQFPLREAGMELITLPPASPNLNAFAERFVRSIKQEFLDNIIPLGEKHFRNAVTEYIDHYNTERPHQGADIGNELLIDKERIERLKQRDGPVQKKARLGGLLNFYYRLAD